MIWPLSWLFKPIKDTDLAEIKALNTLSISGSLFSFPTYMTFLEAKDKTQFSPFLLSLVTSLKNWHTQKFTYEGMPDTIPRIELERLLFLWGKACFFRIFDGTKDRFYIANYTIITRNVYGLATKVRPMMPYSKQFPDRVVDKDCILIKNDSSFLWGDAPAYGTLWRVWSLIETCVESWNLVKRNLITMKQFAKVPYETDKNNISAIEDMFRSENLVIAMDNNFLSSLKKRGNESSEFIDFNDKTQSVWECWKNSFDVLQNFLGICSNSNSEKKERQIVAEVQAGNEIPYSQVEMMTIRRKEAIEKINEKFGLNIKVVIKDDIMNLSENGGNEEPNGVDRGE